MSDIKNKPLTGSAAYGEKRFAVVTDPDVYAEPSMFVRGDEMEITQSGVLIVWGGRREFVGGRPYVREIVITFGPGFWRSAYLVGGSNLPLGMVKNVNS